MDTNKILEHIVDITKGKCSIVEESILKLDKEEDRMIQIGLLTLFEEIEYNKKRLEESVAEKEILLKEVHHRVNNNLQLIISLLNLQKDFIKDEKAKSLLLDSRSRVRAMSLIHQKLFVAKNLGRVNYKDYLEELVNETKNAYSKTQEDLNIHLDIDPFNLDLDTGIPLGLIINEILTNSMKYGLNSNEKIEIYLEAKEVKPNRFEVKMGDNGPGYSDDIFNYGEETLGIQLIKDLTAQIDGTTEKLGHPAKKGTHYRIHFEVSDK